MKCLDEDDGVNEGNINDRFNTCWGNMKKER